MMSKFVLNKENIKDYFIGNVVPNLPFSLDLETPQEYQEITEHTNVNFLFRVSFKSINSSISSLILKHAQDWVKVKPEIEFESDRNSTEGKVLTIFRDIWGEGSVPKVYYQDYNNNVLVLEDFGRDCLVLASEFDKNVVHPEVADVLGERLGILHASTYGGNETVRKNQEEDSFKEYFTNFKMAGAKKVNEKATIDLIESGREVTEALIWGDPVPKNILISKKGIHFIDMEGSLQWDPAFDFGHAAAHWLIKYLECPNLELEVEKALSNLFGAYKRELNKVVGNSDIKALVLRSNRYAGATLLHRLKGLSQFDIPEKRMKNILRVGENLLVKGDDYLINSKLIFYEE